MVDNEKEALDHGTKRMIIEEMTEQQDRMLEARAINMELLERGE